MNNNRIKQFFQPVVLQAILLFMLAVAVYANTLGNGYVFDDAAVVKENAYVAAGIKSVPELLVTPYHKGFTKMRHDTAAINDIYRPLSLITFAVEQELFGSIPAEGHGINVLLFGCCVVLLFRFLDNLFYRQKTSVAFLAALLFALHPIHTEVVANIKSRDELLCFFFAFSALLVFMRPAASRPWLWLPLGALFLFLSLMAKETSISLLAVIPFIFFFYKNENKKRSIIITAASAVTVVAYLIIRFAVLKANHANNSADLTFIDNELVGAPSPATRVATAMFIMGYYLRLLFVPYPLICDYSCNSIPFAGFGNIWVLLSIAAYVSLAVIAVARLRKYRKDPYAFAIIFFLATLALFSNLVLLIGAAMAERFLFFASAGFCLLAALLAVRVFSRQPPGKYGLPPRLWLVIGPVCIVFACLTVMRNSDWKDNRTLFTTDVRKSPNDARLWYAIAFETISTVYDDADDTAAKRQLLLQGAADFSNAVAIYPAYLKAQADLGSLYVRMQQYDSAEVHMKAAVALSPADPAIISALGGVYFSSGKYRQALEYCKMANAVSPADATIINNMGMAYLLLQQYDSAISVSYSALRTAPGNTLAFENLARGYKLLNNLDSARKYAAMAAEADPGFRIE